MPQLVDVEGIGQVEFPDHYTPAMIQDYWKENFQPKLQQEERIRAGVLASQRPEDTPNWDALKSTTRQMVADPAIDIARGVIGVPEAAVGLLDIPTLGYTGKALENIPYGPRFGETKQILGNLYSPERQAAMQKVKEAKGFTPTLEAMVENPSTLVGTTLESLPSMFGGGAIAQKGLSAIAKIGPRTAAWAAGDLAPVVAGAAGEAAVSAGQTAEQIREETPNRALTWEQAGLALGSGALTGAIGVASGKLAQKLGIEKLETMLAKGGSTTTAKSLGERIAKGIGGAIAEGLFEELPQSTQEQIAQNMALGKPWDEGVGEQAAAGLLAGAAMGGVAGGFGPKGHATPGPVQTLPPAGGPQGAPVTPATAPVAPAPAVRTTPQAPQSIAPLPQQPGMVLNTPIQSWQRPGTGSQPHALALSPDSFFPGQEVVKLSQSGGEFGKTGTVVDVTGPRYDGNPNATVTVKFPDGATKTTGFAEFGHAEHFQQAQQQIAAAKGKPFEFTASAPQGTPVQVTAPEPSKTPSKRTTPLTESEKLVEQIAEARRNGDIPKARELAKQLDYLGAPKAEASMPARPATPFNIQREPVITPEIAAAAQAAVRNQNANDLKLSLETDAELNARVPISERGKAITERMDATRRIASTIQPGDVIVNESGDRYTVQDANKDGTFNVITDGGGHGVGFQFLPGYTVERSGGVPEVKRVENPRAVLAGARRLSLTNPNAIAGAAKKGIEQTPFIPTEVHLTPLPTGNITLSRWESITKPSNMAEDLERGRWFSNEDPEKIPHKGVGKRLIQISIPASEASKFRRGENGFLLPSDLADEARKNASLTNPQGVVAVRSEPAPNTYSQTPTPTTFNSVKELLEFRRKRIAEEVSLYRQEIGLTQKEAQELHDLVFREASTKKFEQRIGPEKAARMEQFFEHSPYNKKGHPFEFWEGDRRIDPEQIAHETDAELLASAIVSAVTRGVSGSVTSDRFIGAAIAARRMKELGLTKSDLIRHIDRYTTRTSGSQGDKVEFANTISKQVSEFLASVGVDLPTGDLQRTVKAEKPSGRLSLVNPKGVVAPAIESAVPVIDATAKFDAGLKADRAAYYNEVSKRPVEQQPPRIWYESEAAKQGIGPNELTGDEIRAYRQMWDNAVKAAIAGDRPVYAIMERPPKKGWVKRGEIWYPPSSPESPSTYIVGQGVPYAGRIYRVLSVKGDQVHIQDNAVGGEKRWVSKAQLKLAQEMARQKAPVGEPDELPIAPAPQFNRGDGFYITQKGLDVGEGPFQTRAEAAEFADTEIGGRVKIVEVANSKLTSGPERAKLGQQMNTAPTEQAPSALEKTLPEHMVASQYPPPAHNEPDLVLIGCGKDKVAGNSPVPAADLYTGQLFKARRAFAEGDKRPWMILSAGHGVIEPGKKISPYDVTFSDLSKAERETWEKSVRAKILEYFENRSDAIGKTIEVHAGSEYVSALRAALTGLGIEVVPAFQGKGIGVQLHIYAKGYERPHITGKFGDLEKRKFFQVPTQIETTPQQPTPLQTPEEKLIAERSTPRTGTPERATLDAKLKATVDAADAAYDKLSALREQANAAKYGSKAKEKLEAQAAKASDEYARLKPSREEAVKLRQQMGLEDLAEQNVPIASDYAKRMAEANRTRTAPENPSARKSNSERARDKEDIAYKIAGEELEQAYLARGLTDEEAKAEALSHLSSLHGYPLAEGKKMVERLDRMAEVVKEQREKNKLLEEFDAIENPVSGTQKDKFRARVESKYGPLAESQKALEEYRQWAAQNVAELENKERAEKQAVQENAERNTAELVSQPTSKFSIRDYGNERLEPGRFASNSAMMVDLEAALPKEAKKFSEQTSAARGTTPQKAALDRVWKPTTATRSEQLVHAGYRTSRAAGAELSYYINPKTGGYWAIDRAVEGLIGRLFGSGLTVHQGAAELGKTTPLVFFRGDKPVAIAMPFAIGPGTEIDAKAALEKVGKTTPAENPTQKEGAVAKEPWMIAQERLNADDAEGAVAALKGLKLEALQEQLKRLGFNAVYNVPSAAKLLQRFSDIAPQNTKSETDKRRIESRKKDLERAIADQTANLKRHDEVVASGGPSYAGLRPGETRADAVRRLSEYTAELDGLNKAATPSPAPSASRSQSVAQEGALGSEAAPASSLTPAERATAAGQKKMASEAASVATVLMLNQKVREKSPGQAWSDQQIHAATGNQSLLNSIRDDLLPIYNELYKKPPLTADAAIAAIDELQKKIKGKQFSDPFLSTVWGPFALQVAKQLIRLGRPLEIAIREAIARVQQQFPAANINTGEAEKAVQTELKLENEALKNAEKTKINRLEVDAASESIPQLAAQQYADLEAGYSTLEKTAYEKAQFRKAKSDLSNLTNLADGAIRKLPDDRRHPDLYPKVTDGVSVVNGRVQVDDSFSNKLSALGIQHNPDNVKAMQAELHFEQLARKASDARERLQDLQDRLAYYQKIKAPPADIQRLQDLIAKNAAAATAAEQVAIERNGQDALIGERVNELKQAEAERMEAQAKVDALHIGPVADFFGAGTARLRNLFAKAKASAALIEELRKNTTDPEALKAYAEEYRRYDELPTTLERALAENSPLDQRQRDAVAANLQLALAEFNDARNEMNALLQQEEHEIIKRIEEAQKSFSKSANSVQENEALVQSALNAAKGDPSLAHSVLTAAEIDSLMNNVTAVANLAKHLGENLTQNRWLYDFLSGWRSSPGGSVTFSNLDAASLNVSPEVLQKVIDVASSSPSFASAIVSLADAAAAAKAASVPIQLASTLPSIADALKQGGKQGLNAAAQTASQFARAVNPAITASRADNRQAAKLINSLLTRLMALHYGANLFNNMVQSPEFQALKRDIELGVGGSPQKMIERLPTGFIFKEFGEAGKTPTHREVVLSVLEDPSSMERARKTMLAWFDAAQKYVDGYDQAFWLHALDPKTSKSPTELGFNESVARGLAAEIDIGRGEFLDTGFNRLKTTDSVRKLMKLPLFRQHDAAARMVGGLVGNAMRSSLGRWVQGMMDSKRVSARFEDLPKLTSEAMHSHRDPKNPRNNAYLNYEAYRKQVLNPMAHEGRKFDSELKVGYQLPTGAIVTKEDMALLERMLVLNGMQRTEVTETNPLRGVRVTVGGKTYVRRSGSVGQFGMDRHLNRHSGAFAADATVAYQSTPGFDSSTDLSPASTNTVVQFWNNRPQMLIDHVIDSDRSDRKMKLDPAMQDAEKRLAALWKAGLETKPTNLAELVSQLATTLNPMAGVNPVSYVTERLNSELLNYQKEAERIQKERNEESARNSGLKIALSADNEFTKPAALLELPSSLYDYGALTPDERIAKQSSAHHEALVEYANAVQRGIEELQNRLRRYNDSTNPIPAKDAAEHYGGNINELEDTLKILRAIHKDFLAAFSVNDPSLAPSRLVSEMGKWAVSGVLALPTVNIRNLTQGQFLVYLSDIAMGITLNRLALWNAVSKMPRGLARLSYVWANGMAKFVDKNLIRHGNALEKVVDVVADAVVAPARLALRNPAISTAGWKAQLEQVKNLGYDTKQGWVDAMKAAWLESALFTNRKEQEWAERNPKLAAANRAALTAAKTINAFFGSIGVENSDQVLNSLNLASAAALEQRLVEVARQYGKRLEDSGKTVFDPADPAFQLKPSEWTTTGNEQARADALANARLLFQTSASAEGFQLEHALWKFYQDEQAGREAHIYTDRQREAVTRTLLAMMNASLPTNRASVGAGNALWRSVLTLQGYPADAMMKMINVAFGGTRDRRVAATIGAKLPMLFGIAAMMVLAGAAADGASEYWKRRMQAIQSAQAGVLDKDFWENKDKFAAGVGRFLASNMFYLGDIILGMQNQIQGGRGFDPASRVFLVSVLNAFAQAFRETAATYSGNFPASHLVQPFIDFAARMTPGANEMRKLFGANTYEQQAKSISRAEARSFGMELPKTGAAPSAGPTTVARRFLAAAVGEMEEARRNNDQAAYQKAVAKAQEEIGYIHDYYVKHRTELGDSPAEAEKHAKQAVWRDYQDINPVVAALGGRRPTTAEYQSIVAGPTGERAEAQQRGIAAWQAGAQALFGKTGVTTKEEAASSRGGGIPQNVSVAATGGGGGGGSTGMISTGRGGGGRMRSVRLGRLSLRPRQPGKSRLSLSTRSALPRPRPTTFKRLSLSVNSA